MCECVNAVPHITPRLYEVLVRPNINVNKLICEYIYFKCGYFKRKSLIRVYL